MTARRARRLSLQSPTEPEGQLWAVKALSSTDQYGRPDWYAPGISRRFAKRTAHYWRTHGQPCVILRVSYDPERDRFVTETGEIVLPRRY